MFAFRWRCIDSPIGTPVLAGDQQGCAHEKLRKLKVDENTLRSIPTNNKAMQVNSIILTVLVLVCLVEKSGTFGATNRRRASANR